MFVDWQRKLRVPPLEQLPPAPDRIDPSYDEAQWALVLSNPSYCKEGNEVVLDNRRAPVLNAVALANFAAQAAPLA